MSDKPKEEDQADEKLLSHGKEENGQNGNQVVASTEKDQGKDLVPIELLIPNKSFYILSL